MSARSSTRIDRVGRRTVLATLGAFALGACGKSQASSQEITLAAAASLRTVMPDIVAAFGAKSPHVKVSVTYGASGDLRKQVEGGAPIDGVLFASAKPVDDLITKGLVDAASRAVIAKNRLVLIGPKAALPLTFQTLNQIPDGEKLAIGDPGPVPAGQYAKEALVSLGEWDALQSKLVLGGDVGAVLQYAKRGEVAAAIVYETEAAGVSDIVVLDRASGDWAPTPEVVVGLVKDASGAPVAQEFLRYLTTPTAQSILAEHGFLPP
ncbi:MAG: molybdate ABC transporter substrate-binding protein [Polyangiaceae bacterium]